MSISLSNYRLYRVSKNNNHYYRLQLTYYSSFTCISINQVCIIEIYNFLYYLFLIIRSMVPKKIPHVIKRGKAGIVQVHALTPSQ